MSSKMTSVLSTKAYLITTCATKHGTVPFFFQYKDRILDSYVKDKTVARGLIFNMEPLIYNIEIHILARRHVYIDSAPCANFLECIDRDMKRYHLWSSIYNPQAMCIFFVILVYLCCGLILQFYFTGTGTIIQSPQSAIAEYWWMPHMSKNKSVFQMYIYKVVIKLRLSELYLAYR